MMSSNRNDYHSATEWLSALRHDEAWLCQQRQLQQSSSDNLKGHLDAAKRRIGDGLLFEYWEIYHQVESAVNEVWDITDLTLAKLKIQTIGVLSMEWLEQHGGQDKEVPERLKTEEAEELMEDLVDAGMLTEDWQPEGLSGPERALVAKAVCDRLEVNEVWQLFGQLWGEKPETLRAYYNKAMEQKKSLKFQDRLKNILG
jgi:hypothetical protein